MSSDKWRDRQQQEEKIRMLVLQSLVSPSVLKLSTSGHFLTL